MVDALKLNRYQLVLAESVTVGVCAGNGTLQLNSSSSGYQR